MKELKRGEYVIVTSEEYSDYGIMCFCQVQQDFSPHTEAQRYLELFPEEKESYSARLDKFNDWLINEKFLKKLAYKELNVGAYSELKPDVIAGA